MQDDKIVALYWQRDENAIRETEQKYGHYLSKIAHNILSNIEDSREAVNDTYLRAWNSMPPHRPDVLATYLGKITRQLSIDIFRRRNREKRRASEYALSLSELEECVCGDKQEWLAGEWKRYKEGDVPEEYYNPTKYMVEADGVTIEIDRTLTAAIWYDPPIALPDEYNYTYHAPYEDFVKVAEYLKNEYSHLIGMETPQTDIKGGDYNIYLDQNYYINFYDAADDDTSRIINYNFNPVTFYCNPYGKLDLIRINHPDLSLKVGDYPIITTDAAKELLLAGNFLTSVPYDMPGLDYIKKVELIYLTGELNQYFIPFYRFYMEVPDAGYPKELENSGVKTYGAYYVPAVEGRYLTNMPIWDGQFN